MSKARPLLIHLALGLAGWGIATALSPNFKKSERENAETSATLPTKISRPRLDLIAGDHLLDRLVRENPLPERRASVGWVRSSLRERIDYLADERGLSPDDPFLRQEAERLIFQDLHHLLQSSSEETPDYIYAFKHGEMEALDVLEAVAALLPEQALHPGFSKSLYQVLFREDPDRAESLLSGYPPDDVTALKTTFLSPRNESLDPDLFFKLMHSLQPPRDLSEAAARQEIWNDRSSTYLMRYPESYPNWVLSLPAGPDRDSALHALEQAYATD